MDVAVERWWLPPLLRLAMLAAALAAAGLALAALLARVDPPSVGSLLQDHGYLGVAAGAYLDTFGLPSSGEVVLLLASAGGFSLPAVIGVAWVFALLGDITAYALGRVAGRRALPRIGLHEDSRVHGFIDRHGARAVVGARMLGGVRTKLAVVAGSTGMPVHRYLLADALAAALWAVAVGLAGHAFAGSVTRIAAHLGAAGHALGLAGAVIVSLAAAALAVRYVVGHRPRPAGSG